MTLRYAISYLGRLALALGATLFVLVGLLGLIPAYWMPLG